MHMKKSDEIIAAAGTSNTEKKSKATQSVEPRQITVTSKDLTPIDPAEMVEKLILHEETMREGTPDPTNLKKNTRMLREQMSKEGVVGKSISSTEHKRGKNVTLSFRSGTNSIATDCRPTPTTEAYKLNSTETKTKIMVVNKKL
jgi:hypothetical protein